MTHSEARKSGKTQVTLPDGTTVDGLSPTIAKKFSPRCKVCVSAFFADIQKWLIDGRRNSWISKQLAARGEMITPQAIGRHKKNHLQDVATIRAIYLSKADMDPRQEIIGQINLTKLELEDAVDVAYRKFLMARIDKLLKMLSDHDTKLVRAAAKGDKVTNIDARQQSVNVVAANHPGGGREIDESAFALLEEKLGKIKAHIESGRLEIVDALPEKASSPRPKPDVVLFTEPYTLDEDDENEQDV